MKPVRFSLYFAAVLLHLVFSPNLFAQSFKDEDVKVFKDVVETLLPYKELPMNQLVTKTALYFVEKATPYVAGTLEEIPERLTINLHQTDCILFVEMCTAISMTIKEDNPSFENYCSNIQKMRYRNGIVDGYASRIHYTSEWLLQNNQLGILEEVSAKYGSPLNQTFSYMSTHPQSYLQLKESYDLVRQISIVEKEIESHSPFYYISNKQLKKSTDYITNGDIICFVSNVEGLDISHVALAYRVDGEVHFIHASSREKKVVIEKKSLADYAKNGIRLAILK